jgi:hypothetical protein
MNSISGPRVAAPMNIVDLDARRMERPIHVAVR